MPTTLPDPVRGVRLKKDVACICAMSDSPTSKPTIVHYGQWRTRFILALVALALGVFLWFKGEDAFGRWIGVVLLVPLGLFCLVASETRFDFSNRVVERRWALLGVLTVLRRRLPLAEFRQICWQSAGSFEEGAGRTWKVGLEQSSGRRVFVSYFNARSNCVCDEAKRFAVELSKLTGLPLSHEIDAG